MGEESLLSSTVCFSSVPTQPSPEAAHHGQPGVSRESGLRWAGDRRVALARVSCLPSPESAVPAERCSGYWAGPRMLSGPVGVACALGRGATPASSPEGTASCCPSLALVGCLSTPLRSGGTSSTRWGGAQGHPCAHQYLSPWGQTVAVSGSARVTFQSMVRHHRPLWGEWIPSAPAAALHTSLPNCPLCPCRLHPGRSLVTLRQPPARTPRLCQAPQTVPGASVLSQHCGHALKERPRALATALLPTLRPPLYTAQASPQAQPRALTCPPSPRGWVCAAEVCGETGEEGSEGHKLEAGGTLGFGGGRGTRERRSEVGGTRASEDRGRSRPAADGGATGEPVRSTAGGEGPRGRHLSRNFRYDRPPPPPVPLPVCAAPAFWSPLRRVGGGGGLGVPGA